MMLSKLLNLIAEWAYRARHSRAANVAFVVALAVCVALLALARAEGQEDTTVIPFDGNSSLVSRLNRYVSVTGVLLSERAFRTQVEVGGLTLSGARYVPLVVEGASDPLLVLDKNLPRSGADGQVRLVGKIQEGGAQVPYYLEVGTPPNIPLQNALARVGAISGVGLAFLALVAWLIARADYAIVVGWPAVSSAPAGVGALWFGSLGAAFGHAVVRQSPVTVTKVRDEIRLESCASRPPWTVHIRKVRSVQPAHVATAYGPLPAARITFQDERGLLRRGTIAVGGDPQTRSVLHPWLSGRMR